MKKIFLFALLCVIAPGTKAQGTYNKALADSLGADEYGMKMYTFVILKTGENKTTDKAKIDSAFKGHMANISKLAANGKLVVAGPMGKNDKNYRGIFIFNVKTVAEAQELLKGDPAVQSGILAAEIYPWYGSAALHVYLETHKKIEKVSH
jgi:uncharacterized protein YciI